MPPDPLVRRRPADPELLGHVRCRPARVHASDQELTTEDREAGPRMCHESLPLGLVLNNPKPCGGTLICQQRLWGLQLAAIATAPARSAASRIARSTWRGRTSPPPMASTYAACAVSNSLFASRWAPRPSAVSTTR